MNERVKELVNGAGMTIGQELKIVASGVRGGRSVYQNERISELMNRSEIYQKTQISNKRS